MRDRDPYQVNISDDSGRGAQEMGATHNVVYSDVVQESPCSYAFLSGDQKK